jgi:hypothetical protein
MKTSKATAKSDSKQVPTVAVLEKQQDLIRELHYLLTRYAPTWYKEELDTRLSETLAISTSSKSQTRD